VQTLIPLHSPFCGGSGPELTAFEQVGGELSTVIKVPFKMLSLKKIKRRDTKSDEAVTEEKFALMTYATVAVGDLTILVHTMSNPVVVIVHGNQFSDAMATAVWDTFFAEPVDARPCYRCMKRDRKIWTNSV